MTDILKEILAAKREEIAQRRAQASQVELEQRIAQMPSPLNFSGALWGEGVRLIAEVKKASPSRGLLRADFDPVSLARTYAESGAAAVSVLTDLHFQGTIEHLLAVKEALTPLGVPVLRKDFTLDSYQIYEARAHGADALLLIVAVLGKARLGELLSVAKDLWVQCLVEVHDEQELQTALEAGAEIIGINNRDLRTFQTDIAVTQALAPKVPRGKVLVSESGIASREDVVRLGRLGVHAVLVGEALVTAPDVGARVQELLGQPVEAR